MKIYFDGGCRPNPGKLETAVMVGGALHVRTDHGMGDNSDGEWLALIEAARMAQAMGIDDAILIGDNKMVIDQASGRAPRIPIRFHGHLAQFRAVAATIGRVRLRHIRRGQNLAGIALEKYHGRI